jgi:anti-anti-sigma factor
MQLTYEDLADRVRLIRLTGRMDLEGSREIELRFATLTALDRHTVVVDLAEVEFMASLGLATLVSGARVLDARGGRMLLAGPRDGVAKVLELARIRQIIAVFDDVSLALAKANVTGA